MDIDTMTPDELRRRLRDALTELESLKRRLESGARSNEYTVMHDGIGYRVVESWKVAPR